MGFKNKSDKSSWIAAGDSSALTSSHSVHPSRLILGSEAIRPAHPAGSGVTAAVLAEVSCGSGPRGTTMPPLPGMRKRQVLHVRSTWRTYLRRLDSSSSFSKCRSCREQESRTSTVSQGFQFKVFFSFFPGGISVLLSGLVVPCGSEPYRQHEAGEMKFACHLYWTDAAATKAGS